MPPYEVTLGTLATAIALYGIVCAVVFFATEHTRYQIREAAREAVISGVPVTRGFKLRKRAKLVAITALVVVIGAGVVNGITFRAAHAYNDQGRPTNAIEAARAFGLESGVSYPLVLGDRVDGTNGGVDISLSRGFFTARANVSVTMTPGSSLSVNFVLQDKSYILEIPVMRSTFIQKPGVDPTVTLHLNPVTSSYYGETVHDASRPCTAVIRTAILMCNRIITSTQTVDDPTIRRGLAKLISEEDVLDSATFVVTPEMYSKIVGTGG